MPRRYVQSGKPRKGSPPGPPPMCICGICKRCKNREAVKKYQKTHGRKEKGLREYGAPDWF